MEMIEPDISASPGKMLLEPGDDRDHGPEQRHIDDGRADERRRIGLKRLGLGRLLEQVRHGDHGGERRVLHHVDAVVGQRRNDDADRLRQDHIDHHVLVRQAERGGCLELTMRNGLDARPENLGRIGGGDKRQSGDGERKGDSRMPMKGSA